VFLAKPCIVSKCCMQDMNSDLAAGVPRGIDVAACLQILLIELQVSTIHCALN
jgi:hypothetical protein